MVRKNPECGNDAVLRAELHSRHVFRSDADRQAGRLEVREERLDGTRIALLSNAVRRFVTQIYGFRAVLRRARGVLGVGAVRKEL